jgi:hypothetical protein
MQRNDSIIYTAYKTLVSIALRWSIERVGSHPILENVTTKFFKKYCHGDTPTITSYNASAVKTYNATSSLVESKNVFRYFEQCSTLHTTTIGSCRHDFVIKYYVITRYNID